MSSPVVTVSATATVREAAQRMRERNVSALLVRSSSAGIVTTTDVVAVVADGRDPAAIEVADVMTRSVETVTPELHLDEAAAMMVTYDIKHLPVEADDFVGMLSSSDMAALLS